MAARHGTRQQTRTEIVNLASIPLIFLGGWTGYAIRQGANVGIPLGFLTFSRAFENEADLLGIQYMYKAGYDPTASIDIFERIESLEKRKPGAMAKIFSSHPMTGDRIARAQQNINQILPEKSEYVVNTSEYNQIHERMIAIHRRTKREAADPARPTLQRAPGAGKTTEPGRDDRPVLKRLDEEL